MSDSLPVMDPATAEQLQEAAHKAAANAYAPYSRFRVGAALLFEDGFIASGCNVENMSYGLTNCAERSALFSAVSHRGANHKIVAIAVTNLNGAASPPCGACRQVLSEFVAPDAVVLFPGDNGPELHSFAELFPLAFHLDAQ
ncbi:MAG TPA: cytidine deaminase [Silvibacterium sp.]|nr:cytidine deaminase [Silvibacterium sp.]